MRRRLNEQTYLPLANDNKIHPGTRDCDHQQSRHHDARQFELVLLADSKFLDNDSGNREKRQIAQKRDGAICDVNDAPLQTLVLRRVDLECIGPECSHRKAVEDDESHLWKPEGHHDTGGDADCPRQSTLAICDASKECQTR
jgi:hypothetical protein